MATSHYSFPMMLFHYILLSPNTPKAKNKKKGHPCGHPFKSFKNSCLLIHPSSIVGYNGTIGAGIKLITCFDILILEFNRPVKVLVSKLV